MLRNAVVAESDIQVVIPHRLYRETLAWIRRTHRSLIVDESVAQAVEARLHMVEAIKPSR
jgi:hypothetical protein